MTVAPLRTTAANAASIFASIADAEDSRATMTSRPSRSTRSKSPHVFRKTSKTRWFASSCPIRTQYWDSFAIPGSRKRTPRSNSSSFCQKWIRWLPSATSSSVMPKGIWSFILFLHRPRIGDAKVFPGWKGNLLGVGIFNVAKRRMGIIL